MSSRWPRPDFLPPPRRAPWLAWLWACTGLAVLGGVVTDGMAVQQQIEDQQARLTQAQRHTPARRPARPVAATDAKQDPERLRAAWLTADRLTHPWDELFTAIESVTPDHLRWLALDHDSASPDLRLEGLAPDVATPLRLVEQLAARDGWRQVALSRLQPPNALESAGNGAAWHFELHASVDATRLARLPDPGAH